MSDFRLFASTGKPILHSKSPQLHNAAFAALKIDGEYTRLAAEDATEMLKSAKRMGMNGVSITSPFKEKMLALVDRCDTVAKKIGAINTVIIRNGKTLGFNTDAYGVSQALLANKVKIKGKNAVVIGAGGAAKAAVAALVSNGAKVTIANRTLEKAKKIAKIFGCNFSSLDADIGELEKVMQDADIVVSTASTKERIIPPALLRKNMVVLDAIYSSTTAISKDAQAKGCKVINGREWLLFQGVKAFELFSGKKAPVAAMRKALHAKQEKQKTRKKMKNVSLIGFMGSGKSSTAKVLATISKMKSIDIDSKIEKKAGSTISDIFQKKGEATFRKMEHDEIKKTCSCNNHIISCGGGAVIDKRNLRLLMENSVVVFLFTTPEDTLRYTKGNSARPLLNVKNKLKKIEELFAKRLPFYIKCADMCIDSGNKTPKQMAERIKYEIDFAFKH